MQDSSVKGQAIVHSEKRVLSQNKEDTSSGILLYLGYRLAKQKGPAMERNRWSFDEIDSDFDENDDENEIEVREEVETRGVHGKISMLYEVTL